MTDAGEALLQNSLVLYDDYPESELWELDVFHDDRWQQIQQEFFSGCDCCTTACIRGSRAS